MTDKTQPTGAGVPAAQLDAILLAMHLRQRAKLTATGNADALSQNAANVLVAQYDRIAELKAEGSRLQNGLEAQRMLTDRAISVAKDLDAQAAAKCLHQGADAGAVAALKGLLSLVRREAPQLSGKVLGDAESAIATLQAAPPAPAAVAVSDEGAMFEAWVRTHEDAHGAFDDWSARAGWEARAALAAAPAQAGAVPIELRGIKETAEQGGGFWRSCTGCHELNEGHSTGPFSAVFGCALGNGCSECGGIGAVWDDLDYGAMADAMAAPAQEHATQLAGQCGEQDDGLAQAIDERDTAEGWADGLAGLIGAYFGQDIGEHSSAHNPWQEAKDIIEEAEPYRPAAAAPAQAQEDAPIVWPKSRDVGRIGDMSMTASLRVGLDGDNDTYVNVWDENGGGSIEFCTPGAGGGKSSRTRVALLALMVAMEADNAEDPRRDWWAASAAQGGDKP